MNMIMKKLLPSSEAEKMDHSPQINIQLQTNSSALLLHLLNMIYQIEKSVPRGRIFSFQGSLVHMVKLAVTPSGRKIMVTD